MWNRERARRTASQAAARALAVTTPIEFRALLGEVLIEAELTAGQIAVKSGIPRSQAYNLCSTARTTLPSRPDQVRSFVEACGLHVHEVELILRAWERLNESERPSNAVTPEIDTPVTSAGDTGPPTSAPGRRRRRVVRGSTTALLFLILDERRRTNHALMLLYPVVVAYIATVGGIIVLATTDSIPTSGSVALLAAMVGGPPIVLLRATRRF